MSIPVICDRCRSTGVAGESDFSHLGDLLDFTPVPVQPRANGWDAEAQRAFVALLSATGSKRRAALAIGRNAFGVEQLLKRKDSDSFKAAARNAQLTPPSRLRGLAAPESGFAAEADGYSEEEKLQLVEHLAGKFMKKVALEREMRLSGQIAAADFYLRQITMLEVVFDLTASNFGWDAKEVMRDLRRGGHSLIHIVSTPFADWLDERRRAWWAEEGDPEHPPHPDPRFTRPAEGCTVEREMQAARCADPPPGVAEEEWHKLSIEQRQALIGQIQAEHAEEQRAWERRAHDDWRRRSNPPSP